MSEEVKEAPKVELPLIDEDAVKQSEALAEEFKKVFTPPEGHKFVRTRYTCDRHGDVSRASIPLSYVRYFKNKEDQTVPVMYRDVVCIACLTEALGDIWRAQTGKEFGKITESPIFAPLTEEDKKAMAEAKEKASESTETPEEAKA